MINPSFLDKVAKTVLRDYGDALTDTIIILPNKRARVFLLEAIRRNVNSAVFAPEIVGIEYFVESISDLRQIDSIELLFEFYQVYLVQTKNSEAQSFEVFANWGKTLLADFNEIDRYDIDPNKILKYLEDIKEIEHWSLSPEPKTELVQKHLEFWKSLPQYYTSLYNHLLQKKVGYQGMIYREALRKIEEKSKLLKSKNLVFAGFNALNVAEEKIFQHLVVSCGAKIYWDIDEALLNDAAHDAALFIRKYKNNWPYYRSKPFEWISNEFAQTKNIQIIGTPKSVGQAKIVGGLLDKIVRENSGNNLDSIAVVLGEENLLVPLLYSLPECVDHLNITMGYSSKNNPAQILVSKLFKMHIKAMSRGKSYVFYHKDLLDVLTHPLVDPYTNSRKLIDIIKQNNYSFISHQKVFELQEDPCQIFHLLLDKWDSEVSKVLKRIALLLQEIKQQISDDNEEEKIAKAFLYSVFKIINKLINYTDQYQHINSVEVIFSIYKQIIDLAEVSFEGQPLSGLQIMGVLESRVLDFETVIITSVNEGKFPAGKSGNSFIPYDVKKQYGLPTFKEKDAIYTYHFYHLLQRAKNIYLLYNTDSEGLDAGEKSRFITQLEIDRQPNHILSHEIFNAAMPDTASQLKVVPKSESVMARLHEIAESGFSPSSLTSYIRNPIDFYFKRILRIRELEEVEETIAANTLGTIIHETLKSLYQPLEGKFLSEARLEVFLGRIDQEVLQQFKLVYKEGEINKGRNLLAFEVAKRHVQNFIKKELEEVRGGAEVKIIAIEKTYERWLTHPDLPCPILIKGNVDRIEQRADVVRIVDYKTGKVEKRNVTLRYWDGLTAEVKNDKIIQLLSYAYMFFEEAQGKPIEAGVISFKNLKAGFLPFTIKSENGDSTVISEEVLESYIFEIVLLLKKIYDNQIEFKEKI